MSSAEVERLVRDVDILDLLGTGAVQLKSPTSGGEYAGPCPFPGCGADDDGFLVWPNHPDGRPKFWCRRCDRSGDAVDLLAHRDGISKMTAFRQLGASYTLLHEMNASYKTLHELGATWRELRELGAEIHVLKYLGAPADELEELAKVKPKNGTVGAAEMTAAPGPQRVPPMPEPIEPPAEAWQYRGLTILYKSHLQLWALGSTAADGWALAELRRRGLSDETIQRAELGENPVTWKSKAKNWGLDGRGVWLPRGIIIPWLIGGDLWRLRIRRRPEDLRDGDAKYINARGCSNGLYLADGVRADRPAVIVEGELDALTILQHAGDLVAPVATGGTTGARRLRWIATLAKAPLVLVAYDADAAGDDAAGYWTSALPRQAKRWRPYWGDANAMAQDGASVRGWIEAGIQ